MDADEGNEILISTVKDAISRWENSHIRCPGGDGRNSNLGRGNVVRQESQVVEAFEDEFPERVARPDPPAPRDETDYSTGCHPLLKVNSSSVHRPVPRDIPDPEEHRSTFDRSEHPWFPPVSPSRPSSSLKRRSRRQSRRHQCHCSNFRRVLCLALSITLVILGIALPLVFKRQGQNSQTETMQFQNFLVGRGISSREDLDRYESPQYRAVEWLTTDKGSRRSWWQPILGENSHTSEVLDRYVLAVLFFSLNGGSWSRDLNFLGETHVCDWKMDLEDLVFGSNVTMGVQECRKNEFGLMVPTTIYLDLEGLSGTLPDEIRHLTYLENLHIANNPVMGGSLPSSIHQLGGLQSLSFPGCSIGASFPDWIGDMTQLTLLDLSKNRLRGSLPSHISKLTNLHTLRLGDNLVDSTLDLLSPLSNLRFLEIQYNLFKGELDPTLFSMWPQLIHFNASENQLSGSLPANILGHSTLREIDLRFNRLSGSIPSHLAKSNPKLELLALDWNELDGPLPSALPNLVALKVFGVSSNTLTGTISNSIASLQYLQSLSLSSNSFDPGTVPRFLWRMTNLERLELSKSGLTGTVPESIGFLSALRALDLSWNALTGSLPDELSLLTDLAWLLIEGNNLSGGADLICEGQEDGGFVQLMHFSSDCDVVTYESPVDRLVGGNDTELSSLACTCCNKCCGRGGKLCV